MPVYDTDFTLAVGPAGLITATGPAGLTALTGVSTSYGAGSYGGGLYGGTTVSVALTAAGGARARTRTQGSTGLTHAVSNA